MNKEEFLNELEKALSGLPEDDIKERLFFYSEMIDDRIEEGASENEAVADIGSVDEIASQIISDTPFTKIVKEKITPKRRLQTWEIVLIILGFPLWFPLLIAFGSIVLSIYIVIWSLIISLWAIETSLCSCAIGGFASAIIFFAHGFGLPAVVWIGISLFCTGLSIFMFFACLAASKGIIYFTKNIALRIKSWLIKKEG